MELEIPGCDEGSKYQISRELEMRRAKLSRGKGRARASHGAGAAAQVPDVCGDFRLRRDCQNSERGLILA